MLNVDLRDFFGSISEARVAGMLTALGIPSAVSTIIIRLVCFGGVLPQGAPSSPLISNMICFRLDRELMSFAKEHRLRYTRYADDLTFSSYAPPVGLFANGIPVSGNISSLQLSDEFLKVISTNGFALNEAKCHYAGRRFRHTVTGLTVSSIVNVQRTYIRNLRSTLNQVQKHGLAKAQSDFETKYGGVGSLKSVVRGKISWVGQIKGRADPVYRKIAEKFNSLKIDKPIRIDPSVEEMRDRAVWVLFDVKENESQGTAFFLDGIGLITAYHCVEKKLNYKIFLPTKKPNAFDVSVKFFCKHRDLAILDHKIPSEEFYNLPFAAHQPKVTDSVRALGYPGFGPGDTISVRSGTISSLFKKSAVSYFDVAFKFAQGMSGGPVLSSSGDVVGIIHKGGPEQQRDIAINVNEVTSWLKTVK